MKLTKKSITVLSFTIGACLFVSTAFADTLLGSGYDRLKGSAKNTAAQMEKGLNNYTIEALFTMKDNNQTVLQATTVNKIDMEKQASENSTVDQGPDGKTTSNYSYTDKKLSVWKNGTDNKYYVTEFSNDVNRAARNRFTSPFNDKGAPEIEKLFDALVGNLKDYVQVEERADGAKVYSGSLSEAQVPAVVNAVSSFGFKRMISDHGRMEKDSKLPEIESDIFVKKVLGTAVENKAGIVENVTGDVTLSGKDKNGVQHDLTLNAVFKLSDIGTTKIIIPDLTGANVEKVNQSGGLSSKYAGKYRSNIIIEKNGKFVRIGERILEITSVENDKVTGKYNETVNAGFEADYPDKYNFNFEYNPNDGKSISTFTYVNAKGEQKNGRINPNGLAKIYLDLEIEIRDKDTYSRNNRPYYDGEFNRIFE
ncbi:hypothetical protein GC093_12525 [Paenibacillus sp. LMG 31456]|uniref:S-layer protein n=1 Tax=Paenibacillus foliorum TaxID=2654974 RepID=A0A972GTT6_9BACL|nr:hypothetical protein [Paenibacillus foliorum]NOU94038.1 hypothetical protein [Paenibacillus foliorum]